MAPVPDLVAQLGACILNPTFDLDFDTCVRSSVFVLVLPPYFALHYGSRLRVPGNYFGYA